MSTPLRLYPEDLRNVANDLNGLSSDTDQVQQRLNSSWGRLESGWEWYAEEDIAGYFQRAMRELSLMAAMLEQMGQALVKTADLIEAADQAAVAFFSPAGPITAGPPNLPSYEPGGISYTGTAGLGTLGSGVFPIDPATPTLNPYLSFQSIEALAGYHQYQGDGDSIHCADYSIAMAYNIWLDRSIPRGAAAQHKDGPDISPLIDSSPLGRFPDGSTTPFGIGQAFEKLGVPVRSNLLGGIDELRNELGQGNLVVLSIGQIQAIDPAAPRTYGHVKVAVGYDPAQNRYGFLDPGVDKPAVQWLTEAELKDQWWYDPVHPMWIVEERKQ